MSVFNSYVVFDKEGYLIIDERMTKGTSADYFHSLSLDIQHQAHVMLVLQESGRVARYEIVQPNIPAPILGPREDLSISD